jgi:hypothetical protein
LLAVVASASVPARNTIITIMTATTVKSTVPLTRFGIVVRSFIILTTFHDEDVVSVDIFLMHQDQADQSA